MKISSTLAVFGLAALVTLQIKPAAAGSATATISIAIQPPLTISFAPPSPSIPCNAAPGTVVAAVSTAGGDGNPASFAVTGGDVADFAISGSNVVVASGGLAASSCGKTMPVTVTATQ